jgi:Replication initiation factor
VVRNAALHSSAYAGTPGKVVEAGIDWLTTTATDDAAAQNLGALARTIIRSQERAGNEVKPWRWNGYQGYTTQGASAGSRPDSLIVRVSGEAAREWWRDCYRITGRASRLDVQVTVEDLPDGADLAGWHTAHVDRFQPKNGRPPKWSYIQSKDSGSTLYLGARASDRFYRVYDKSAEEGTGHLAGKWRYEAELKEDVAKLAATLFLERRSDWVTAMTFLHNEFSRRGVKCAFPTRGRTPSITPRREQSDDDRAIEWLRSQVARTVARLIERGRYAEVAEALQLERARSR